MRDADVRAALQARLSQLRLPSRLLRPVSGPNVWEGIARPLEGSLVVLEPLGSGHEEGLFAAAREGRAVWRWLPYDASESRAAFRWWFEEALAASEAAGRRPSSPSTPEPAGPPAAPATAP